MAEENEHGETQHKHRGGGHGHGHGGGGHDEGHEGAPEWLISFADNVTLMMGFFVILLAMNIKAPTTGGIGGHEKNGGSPTSTNEVLDLAIAIREAFNNPVSIDSQDPREQSLVQRLRTRVGESDAQQDGQPGREHDVQSIRPSQYYSPAGTISFDDDASTLSEEALEGIARASGQVRGMNLIIELRGHVSAAEAFDQPDRGMRLSYERASAVAQALAGHGVGWNRLRLISCADNDRLVTPVYGAPGQRVNQRVEIIVTDQVATEAAPTDSHEDK